MPRISRIELVGREVDASLRGLMAEDNSEVSTLELTSERSSATQDDVRRLQDNNLSDELKKRKIEHIYNNGSWISQDEYEISKIRKVVRRYVFKYTKFCIGEGQSSKKDLTPKQKAKNKMLGNTHEMADLTIKNNYISECMKECGMGECEKSLTVRTVWWKTYSNIVLHETRLLRGRMNYNMRKLIFDGEKFLMLFYFHYYQYIINYLFF